jgi:hypothetical protein
MIKENKKVGRLSIQQGKMDRIYLKIVYNALPDLISDFIFEKSQKGWSFEKIGRLFGLHKSTIWRIYKDDYFPKSKKIKDKIFERYLELI